MAGSPFPEPPAAPGEIETATRFSPRFDAAGLVTAVVTASGDGQLLMVAHMNAEALELSLNTGIGHFWSRSRGRIWKKGESSGNLLRIREIRTDCDQDAVWLVVEIEGDGVACHTGRRSCFYRIVRADGTLERS